MADQLHPLRVLTLDQLRKRTSIKWRAYPSDVLPLWVAEMDVPLAQPVVEVVSETMRRGDTGYSAGTGYAEAYADFARQRWGWSFDVDQAVIVPDVMLGIVEMLKLLTEPGDSVVVNSPVYPPFYAFVSHMDRKVVEAPLDENHRIDFAVLEDTFRGAAAYLLCSPHNPTGTVHTRTELERVIALADEHDVRVVVDEIHAPIVYDGQEHQPFLSLPGAEAAISMLSASKAWNLAGLKSAIAVAGPAAVDDLRRMPEEATHGASHVGAIAHIAALRDGRDWLDALVSDLDENRQLLEKLLAQHLPGVRFRLPDATYLAWLDCRGLGLGEDPAAVFLEHGRVALNPGPDFGTGGAGHVRLNLATSPEILDAAVRRMAGALQV